MRKARQRDFANWIEYVSALALMVKDLELCSCGKARMFFPVFGVQQSTCILWLLELSHGNSRSTDLTADSNCKSYHIVISERSRERHETTSLCI